MWSKPIFCAGSHDKVQGVRTYYFKPQYTRNAVVKLVYNDPLKRTIVFTGEHVKTAEQWNQGIPGKVDLCEGEWGFFQGDRLVVREFTRAAESGYATPEFKATVTLRWESYSEEDNGAEYTLPTEGTGFTAERVGGGNGYATYAITITNTSTEIAAADIEIEIGREEVAPNLRFYEQIRMNSPNPATFKTVEFSLLFEENIQTILSDDTNAPKITSVTLTRKSDTYVWSEADADDILAAITYPTTDLWGYTVADVGTLAWFDVRALFHLAEGDSFCNGNMPSEFTFIVTWSYGAGLAEEGSQSYTFTLDPNAYAPGEITHLGVVQASATKPDGTGFGTIDAGSWYIVEGMNAAEMLANAQKYSNTAPLLTFVNDGDGFTAGSSGVWDFTGTDTVVMNGHAYFVGTSYGNDVGRFNIKEEGGTVTVQTEDMRLGSKNIPVWLPIQAGSLGSDTLNITLNKGQTYTIPSEIPEYHKGDNATAKQAKEAWLAEVKDLLENTIVIQPGSNGAELSFTLGALDMQGLKAEVDDIYLLSHGFNVGGMPHIQIPGTADPLLSVEIQMLTTDNTAKLIPFDNVWAEGEARVKLPDFIGGYGGEVAGVFNTYTQDFGFEGAFNAYVIALEGAFYLARSETLKIPVLDRFEAAFEVDAGVLGLGFPPAPAQIIEIQGISGGVSNLANTIDYNPLKNTIPSVRLSLGCSFQLVEVIGFQASMWAELASGGFSVEGGLGIGPLQLDLIKNIEFAIGAKDGEFVPSTNPSTFIKGKRSLLFFINASCHVTLFGIVDGAGGFDISLQISPALWESGGFSSVQDLIDFISLKMKASGYVFASVNVPFTDWTIADAEVYMDIAFEPGSDMESSPFGLRKFEFVATSRLLGMKVSESRFDLVQLSGAKKWLEEQNKAAAASNLNAVEAALLSMNTLLTDPAAAGVSLDQGYTGEHRNLAFGNAVADSETRAGAVRSPAIAALAISQDTAHIKVESDGRNYTHYVTVPDDFTDYVLQMEGYGGNTLTFGDICVIKPNGQALTIREISDTVTAAQAEFGYNAAVIDGVLTLALNDFMNARIPAESTDFEVDAGFETLDGTW